MNTAEMPAKPHHGRNIKRIREMFGIKQEALALELGSDWSQRRISLLEQKEEIDDVVLEEVSKVLKVPVDAIKNFDEKAAMNVISNTFNSHDHSTLNAINHQCTFNPLDKIVELYERMLKDKEEMIRKLEELNQTKV